MRADKSATKAFLAEMALYFWPSYAVLPTPWFCDLLIVKVLTVPLVHNLFRVIVFFKRHSIWECCLEMKMHSLPDRKFILVISSAIRSSWSINENFLCWRVLRFCISVYHAGCQQLASILMDFVQRVWRQKFFNIRYSFLSCTQGIARSSFCKCFMLGRVSWDLFLSL